MSSVIDGIRQARVCGRRSSGGRLFPVRGLAAEKRRSTASTLTLRPSVCLGQLSLLPSAGREIGKLLTVSYGL